MPPPLPSYNIGSQNTPVQLRVNNSYNSNNVHFSNVRLICSPYLVVPVDNDKTRAANEFRLKMNIIVIVSHTITSLISILCCTYIVFTITYSNSIKFLTHFLTQKQLFPLFITNEKTFTFTFTFTFTLVAF